MNNGYWRYVYWYESDIVWLSIRHLSTQIKVLQIYVTILNIKYFVWFLLGFTTNVCSKLGNYKIEQTISVAFLTVLLHDRLDICVKWQTLHCCYSREHWESPVSIEAFVVNCYCFFSSCHLLSCFQLPQAKLTWNEICHSFLVPESHSSSSFQVLYIHGLTVLGLSVPDGGVSGKALRADEII